MKKFYLLAALAAAFTFTSCQKEKEDVNPMKVADFENCSALENGFVSGEFTFQTYTDVSEWGTYYYGFQVSENAGIDYNQADKAACEKAHSGSKYAYWYSSYNGGDKVTLSEAKTIPGCYITNSLCAYNSMLNGDAFAKKFTNEDWFLLTIYGAYKGHAVNTKIDFYLAKDGQIVKDWTYVSLESLGVVDELSFVLTSSDNGEFGMNTPAYFCIDDLGAKK